MDKLEYTQENIGRKFRCGSTLEDLIRDLESGKVDPLQHPNMRLEVVRKFVDGREIVYSNDNIRLYCLKQYQLRNLDRCVWVVVKLYDWVPAYDRLLERLPQRTGLRSNDIRLRGVPSHRP